MSNAYNELAQNPVFKGCTRPPMLAGGPLKPMALTWMLGSLLLLFSLSFSEQSGIGWPLPLTVALLIGIVIVYIRVESKVDEHRLDQQLKRLKEVRKHQGRTRVYFPVQYKNRTNQALAKLQAKWIRRLSGSN